MCIIRFFYSTTIMSKFRYTSENLSILVLSEKTESKKDGTEGMRPQFRL